jgi:hypothetical protein
MSFLERCEICSSHKKSCLGHDIFGMRTMIKIWLTVQAIFFSVFIESRKDFVPAIGGHTTKIEVRFLAGGYMA